MVDLHIPARDGYALAATVYEPAGPPKAWVQFNSATGVPRQFYRHFAVWLAARGLAVVTFDYRGVGGSVQGSLADVPGHIRDWGEQDAAGVADWCAERNGGGPLLVLGHSIGGQLIGLCANNRLYARGLCVAAQSGYWALWPEEYGHRRRRMWEDVPRLVAEHGYFPGRALGSADLPPGIAISWAQWCLSPDYIVDGEGRALREHFRAYTGPLRFLAISDDAVAPLPAVEALIAFYANARTSLEVVTPAEAGVDAIGHFDIFRPAAASLWPRLLAGLDPSTTVQGGTSHVPNAAG